MRLFVGIFLIEVTDVEAPFLALAERRFEFLGKRALLLKMDIARYIAGSSADRTLI